jgi:pilus assembly protein TadC
MVELGAPDIDAWRSLRGHPQLGPAAIDLARSVESGTMLVETLNHHARAARADRRAALQIRARAVGVRSVLPLMICFLPAFLLLGVLPSVVSAILNAFP